MHLISEKASTHAVKVDETAAEKTIAMAKQAPVRRDTLGSRIERQGERRIKSQSSAWVKIPRRHA